MIALGTLTCCFGSDTYDLGGCLAVSFFQEIFVCNRSDDHHPWEHVEK